MFLECLWGIETRFGWLADTDFQKFLECLWGIETTVSKEDIRKRIKGF